MKSIPLFLKKYVLAAASWILIFSPQFSRAFQNQIDCTEENKSLDWSQPQPQYQDPDPIFFDVSMSDMQKITRNNFKITTLLTPQGDQRIQFCGTWPQECQDNSHFITEKDPQTGDMVLTMQVADVCLKSLHKKNSPRVPLNSRMIDGPKYLAPLQILRVAGESEEEVPCLDEESQQSAGEPKAPTKKLNLDMSPIVNQIYLNHSEPERTHVYDYEQQDSDHKNGPLEVQVAKLLQKVALEDPEKLNETQTSLKSIIQDMKTSSKGLFVNGMIDKTGKLLNKIISGNPRYASQAIDDYKGKGKLKTGKKKFVTVNKDSQSAEISINADPLFYRLKQKGPALSKIIDHMDVSHQSNTFVEKNSLNISPVHNTKITFNSNKKEHGVSTELDYTTCDPSLGLSMGSNAADTMNCESTKKFSGKVETEISEKLYFGTKGEISVAPSVADPKTEDINDKQIGIYLRYNN